MDIRGKPKTKRADKKGRGSIKNEVLLSQEFNESFQKLKNGAEKGNGESKYLLAIVNRGIEKLKEDKEAGKRIRKELIPSYYESRYEVTNLWKLNLDASWRLVYTIMGTEVKLMTIVLEVLDHKDYDRRFGYRSR